MTEPQWADRWTAARLFLTADGESGKAGGNETLRVDEAGRLRIKVPATLVDQFGTHLLITVPVGFAHRGQEWLARVTARHAVRYDISYDPAESTGKALAGSTVTFEIHLGGPALFGPIGMLVAGALKGDIRESLNKFKNVFAPA